MFFGLFFALALILLFIRVMTYVIGLGYVATVVVDVLVIGGFSVYYAHHAWFVHIASGKAVYFWDIALLVVIFFIYSAIVTLGTSMFPRIAGLFHYVIAWLATGFIYTLINYILFDGFGALLNNEKMNILVHIILISLLALFIFASRMRVFKQDVR